MSEPNSSRDENEDKPRKCSFKLITRKKKITQKSSRISIGECSAAMGKTWEKESFKDRKNRGSKRERWLLTRKTWRYMADAGRKLIPDGVGNRPEDVPKIEAYFQEVCQKEPKFLLWRKQSYPGALGFRSRSRPRGNRLKLGSVRENTSSADEAENIVKVPSVSFLAHPRPAGRYELEQLRKEFLFGSTENNTLLSNYQCSNSKSDLVQFINDCIGNSEETSPIEESSLDHEQLLEKLEDYISKTKNNKHEFSSENKKSLNTNILESDNTQINLLDTLRRYYARSTNREKVIGDILMDRKLLENLYFELRKTRGFLGRRVIGSSSNLGLTSMNSLSSTWKDTQRNFDRINTSSDYLNIFNDKKKNAFLPNNKVYNLPSPPPVIEIEDMEDKYFDIGIQTLPLEPVVLGLIEDENRRKIDSSETFDNLSKASSKALQRKTSMENDDISPSVSDTIKRYLRMARKKSVETDKVDRFKRVNYDRNIRNIKGKGEPDICEGDDTNKSTQTDDSWLAVLKTIDDNSNSRITSSRSSIDTGTTFSGEELLSPPLSPPPKSLNAPGMQKSRSSTNVQQGFMSKRIWKGRSKSQTRTNTVASLWTPLGNCLWLHASGKSVLLKELCLLELTDLEKEILSFVSLNKLQEINLGVPIRIPTGNVLSAGPKKRRPYLLKRRANTTGNLKDKDDNESLYPHTIFGVSLNDCVEQERASRSHLKVPTEAQYVPKSSRGRSSFSSYIEVPKDSSERSHSCESTSITPVSELIKNFTSSDILSDDNDVDIKSKKNGVPSFVTSCLTYLEKYGLHKVGVFRISSSKKRLRQLREDFDHGKTLEETLSQSEDHVHDVATLLKEYFRALPDALLCNDLYQCFIQTQKIRNRHLQLDAIKHLIQLLPVVNRNTLYALLKFLSIMAKYSEDSKNSYGHTIEGNKMDASNLATLFAPNILHKSLKEISSNELSEEMTMERRLAIDVVTTLIVNCDYLFKVPADLLDEVYVHMLDTNPDGLDNVMTLRFSSVEKTIQNGSNQESKETLLNVQEKIGTNVFPDVDTSKPPETKEKKIWIRGEFTHQNSGIGGYDDTEEYRYKPRERETRRSRSKGATAFFPDDVEAFTYPVFERMQMNKKSEKSINNQIHANGNQVNEYDGVITASLMIPVPMKQSPNSSYPLNVEDTDIPFIEDESRQTNSSVANYHRMLATVSSDSSSISSPPTSPDNVSGTTNYSQDYYHKKNAKFDHRSTSTQSNKDLLKDIDTDHYKADKKGKEKDIKFYQKILSSTGLDRLSKSASSTGVPKNSVYKDKLKLGHDDATLSQEPVKVCSSISNIGGAVLRSKTADIEHILRKQTSSKPRKVSQSLESSGSQEKPKRKTSAEATRHPLRIDPDPNVGERLAGGSSYRSPSPTRNVWRRKDVISSMPKHKKPYN